MAVDWSQIQPVLSAIHKTLNADGYTDNEAINTELGREGDDQATDTALRTLQDAGFIEGYRSFGNVWDNLHLLRPGLETVAGWPARPGDDTYDLLLALLDQRIAEAPSEEEKSRWQKIRDGAASLGRELIIEWIAGGLPH